jgi:hypothetical protein
VALLRLSTRVTFDLDAEERDTAPERLDVLDASELPPDERIPELLAPLPAA